MKNKDNKGLNKHAPTQRTRGTRLSGNEKLIAEKHNAEMMAELNHVFVGRKVSSVSVHERDVTITTENGSQIILKDVEDFELHTGEWKFVPNAAVGRPRKTRAVLAPTAQPDQPLGPETPSPTHRQKEPGTETPPGTKQACSTPKKTEGVL